MDSRPIFFFLDDCVLVFHHMEMVSWRLCFSIDPRTPKLLSLGQACTSKAAGFQHWATMVSDVFSLEIEKLLTSLGSGPSIYYPCSSPSCFVWKIKLFPLPFALLPRTLLPCWVLLVLGVVHHRSHCLKCSCRISPPSLTGCPPTSCRILQHFFVCASFSTLYFSSHT